MKPHVLILEDDFVISCDMANLVAENLHAVPCVATSVTAALEMIPDDVVLALLDVEVTDGLSFPVARKLAENNIPFIFVSGSNNEIVPPEFRKTPFIAKPFDAKQLVKLSKSLSHALV